MTRIIIFIALMLACCCYALARGGAPERIAGAALLCAGGATWLSYSDLVSRFTGVEIGTMVVDVLLLVVLVAVALRADRGWPILLAGLQLASVAAHLLKLVDLNMIRVTYAIAMAMWSYPMLIALALGTWRHRSRLRTHGADRAWSEFRPTA